MKPTGGFPELPPESRTEFGSAFLDPNADYRIQLVKTDRDLTRFLAQDRVILFEISENGNVTSSASSRNHKEPLPTKEEKQRIFARVQAAVHEIHARGGNKPSLFAMTIADPSAACPSQANDPSDETNC